MKIEKEKRKVNIVCQDNSIVRGVVHISPGIRLSDFIDDQDKNFIIVTEAEIHSVKEAGGLEESKKRTIFLNKSFVKLIEEI
jgi:hypothetical protein